MTEGFISGERLAGAACVDSKETLAVLLVEEAFVTRCIAVSAKIHHVAVPIILVMGEPVVGKEDSGELFPGLGLAGDITPVVFLEVDTGLPA